jgi:hypothetical protein
MTNGGLLCVHIFFCLLALKRSCNPTVYWYDQFGFQHLAIDIRLLAKKYLKSKQYSPDGARRLEICNSIYCELDGNEVSHNGVCWEEEANGHLLQALTDPCRNNNQNNLRLQNFDECSAN